MLLAAMATPVFAVERRVENDNRVLPFHKGEQYRVRFRDPAGLPHAAVPYTEPPPTVDRPLPEADAVPMSLDEAIRIALANSEVVRFLTGTFAVSSGRTIYDPAIANTLIDQQRAAFDPFIDARNTWSQTESPTAIIDPLDPLRTRINGIQTQNHNFALDASQTNLSGGTARLRFSNDASQFSPGLFLLNPQNRYATDVSYTQPLLRGFGVLANRVPIVLARIDTERSYFQLNDSVQELIRGVVEAY